MTFPVVVSRTDSETTVASTTHTVSLPATVDPGDLLLVCIAGYTAQTGTIDGGFTEVADITPTVGWFVAYKIADGSEDGGTVTFTSASANETVHSVFRITGAHATSAPEAGTTATASGVTTSGDPASLSPSWGAEDTLWLWMGAARDGTRTVSSYPTNYGSNQNLLRHSGLTLNDPTLAVATRNLNASSENAGTLTYSGNNSSRAGVVAIRPAGGASTSDFFQLFN